jgi:hypothetical protein
MPLPYALKKAQDWKQEDRGLSVAYIPPEVPMGMDIYMMGRYSDVTAAQSKKIGDWLALRFSKHIDPGVTAADMKAATVDGADAIYFESAGPETDRHWRQWAFLKNGQAFVIVSSYSDENKNKVVSAVDAMVNSFHVNESPQGSGAPPTSH